MVKDPSAAWKIRHQRWRRFVQANIRAMHGGKAIPLGPSAHPLIAPKVKASQGECLKVVICSPHPDDEALVGALPLRLRQECGALVTNLAVTLGSNVAKRPRRLRELKSACAVLGFELVLANDPTGLEKVSADSRRDHPTEWAAKVRVLSEALERLSPHAIFAPHAEDFNTTHIGTHHLVVDALGDYLERTGSGPVPLFETEFWHEHTRPNLMVGVSPEDEALLIMAAAEHGGEVRRNPYHLRHPGRMIDNVRRGAEVVGGQGGPAPDFPFAELYRVMFMDGKKLVEPLPGGSVLDPRNKIDWQALIDGFLPARA